MQKVNKNWIKIINKIMVIINEIEIILSYCEKNGKWEKLPKCIKSIKNIKK